jgi:hypothetical protein
MDRAKIWVAFVFCLAAVISAEAATGRVMKVLPLFLDSKGRAALSPSLYERDAYQARLRQHPEQRGGLRFCVQWKARQPVWEPLRLQVELKGTAQGNLPKELVVESAVESTSWLGRWTELTLTGDEYKHLGEVTAWRVTLWEGEQMIGEQKSFLW